MSVDPNTDDAAAQAAEQLRTLSNGEECSLHDASAAAALLLALPYVGSDLARAASPLRFREAGLDVYLREAGAACQALALEGCPEAALAVVAVGLAVPMRPGFNRAPAIRRAQTSQPVVEALLAWELSSGAWRDPDTHRSVVLALGALEAAPSEPSPGTAQALVFAALKAAAGAYVSEAELVATLTKHGRVDARGAVSKLRARLRGSSLEIQTAGSSSDEQGWRLVDVRT